MARTADGSKDTEPELSISGFAMLEPHGRDALVSLARQRQRHKPTMQNMARLTAFYHREFVSRRHDHNG